jgi:hypothetical protein
MLFKEGRATYLVHTCHDELDLAHILMVDRLILFLPHMFEFVAIWRGHPNLGGLLAHLIMYNY